MKIFSTECDGCKAEIRSDQDFIRVIESDCEYYDVSGCWLTCCDFEIFCLECGEDQ